MSVSKLTQKGILPGEMFDLVLVQGFADFFALVYVVHYHRTPDLGSETKDSKIEPRSTLFLNKEVFWVLRSIANIQTRLLTLPPVNNFHVLQIKIS